LNIEGPDLLKVTKAKLNTRMIDFSYTIILLDIIYTLTLANYLVDSPLPT